MDRDISAAIGSKTNPRLEGLTRDLHASIAIDSATRDAVGGAAADFEEKDEVQICGRSEPQTVYSLPLDVPGENTENSQNRWPGVGERVNLTAGQKWSASTSRMNRTRPRK